MRIQLHLMAQHLKNQIKYWRKNLCLTIFGNNLKAELTSEE